MRTRLSASLKIEEPGEQRPNSASGWSRSRGSSTAKETPPPRLLRAPPRPAARLQRKGRRGTARREDQTPRSPASSAAGDPPRRGFSAAPSAPATDHLSSASTPAQRSFPPAHTLLFAAGDAPEPLLSDHHGGAQQRMQHQGALPISAPEPGRDSEGGQVHPHFPRGRQRHYWGECYIRRKLEEGLGCKNIFTPGT